MRESRCVFLAILIFFGLGGIAFSQSSKSLPVFQNGDRVCFVGNSITNNAQFYNFVNLYYATRYPEKKVVFINCGVSGDVTQGVINRMESDILINKPTWSVLMIGMNDVKVGLYAKSKQNEEGIEEKKEKALELYRKNLEIIIQKLLEGGRKLILQKPSIYDQTAEGTTENFLGANDALRKCAHFTQVLADKYNLPVVDYWTIMTDLNARVQQKDPTATIIGPDRVHPGAPGHMIMAYQFLKSTGGSRYVSKIVIEKGPKRSNRGSVNVKVSDVSVKKGGLSFKALEGSLPFPVIEEAEPALKLVPFAEEFNRQILKVTNIPPGKYDLFIDEQKIENFSYEDIRNGIDLAGAKNTPQYRQAIDIMLLLNDYRKTQSMLRNIRTMEIHHLPDSLKNAALVIQESFLISRLEEKYKGSPQYNYYQGQFKSYVANKPQQKKIEETLPELVERIYQTNKPIVHTYKLVKTDP